MRGASRWMSALVGCWLGLVALGAANGPAGVQVPAGGAASNVVRVARYLEYGFCEQQADGSYKGANEELIARLAEMNSWKVEWIACSSSEAVEKLVKGEIDLVAGLSYTEARARQFSFPHLPTGEYGAELVVREGVEADLAHLAGSNRLVVATSADARLNDLLEDYLKKSRISYRLAVYPSYREARLAFYRAQAQALMTIGPFAHKGEQALVEFPCVPAFICVSEQRPDLLQAVDNALEKLRETSPTFITSVVNRHFPRVVPQREVLTIEEQSWLRDRVVRGEPVMVDVSPLLPPLKTWNQARREPMGFTRALFQELSRRTGLLFTFQTPGTSQVGRTRFHAGTVDVWADFGSNAYEAAIDETHRFPILVPQLLICRRDTALPDPSDGKISVPIWDRDRLADYRRGGLESRLVVCSDGLDAVRAVLDGRADATFLSVFLAAMSIRQLHAERVLETRPATHPHDEVIFSFVVSPKAPPQLVGVLRKTMAGVTRSDVAAMMIQTSDEVLRRPFFSMQEWILFVVLGVCGLLFLIGYLDVRKARWKEKKTEERERLIQLRDAFFERAAGELSGPIDAIEARAECLRTPDASREHVLDWTADLIRNADLLIVRLRRLVEHAKMKREYEDKWRQVGGGGPHDD